jgi:RNA recognition motif-containing protein
MAKSNYSAGKRQRERDKEKKRKAKMDRARDRQSGGADIPIATVDEIQGGMMSVDEVMRSMNPGDEDGASAPRNTIPSRLFVGGLNWRTTNDELRTKLEEFGPVTDVHIVTDRDTGDSRGFGFVTMADRKDAAQAIRDLDGQEFAGRTLVVRQATERGR